MKNGISIAIYDLKKYIKKRIKQSNSCIAEMCKEDAERDDWAWLEQIKYNVEEVRWAKKKLKSLKEKLEREEK